MRSRRLLVAVVATLWASVAGADEVAGADRLLCSVASATHCTPDGECDEAAAEILELQKDAENFKKAFSACMEAKSYTVKY